MNKPKLYTETWANTQEWITFLFRVYLEPEDC